MKKLNRQEKCFCQKHIFLSQEAASVSFSALSVLIFYPGILKEYFFKD
jgi:hypothetical protein